MTPTSEENTALVRRFLTDVVAGGDHDALDAFVSDDIADHNLVFEDGDGREAVSVIERTMLAAATDVEIAFEDFVAAADTVAVRATVSGTHDGTLLDLTRTGESFEIAYVWFCRIEDDQIAEVWALPDGLGLMQQLDAIPTES